MTKTTLDDYAPEGVESGVGLCIQDSGGRYLFFLAGTRHRCPPGELFYAGIGGHREPGETWSDCAEREAQEEIGAGVELNSSSTTWHIPLKGPAVTIELEDEPQPLALYEMIHPENTPRAGEVYRLAIYLAQLQDTPKVLPPDEISGVIALLPWQVIQGIKRKPTLGIVIEEGAEMLLDPNNIPRKIRLYPLGTAVALAHVLPKLSD